MPLAIAALSSQNPEVITIAKAVFGAKPYLNSDLLVKALQMDKNGVPKLQATL